MRKDQNREFSLVPQNSGHALLLLLMFLVFLQNVQYNRSWIDAAGLSVFQSTEGERIAAPPLSQEEGLKALKALNEKYDSKFEKLAEKYGSMTSLKGTANSMYHEGDTSSITLELKDGMYLQVKSGSAIFTPYQGNSFSFK